jgi:deoxyribonuclease V
MIAAFDVYYNEDGTALTSAVLFQSFTDSHPIKTYSMDISTVEEYIPGSFYKRELPCILKLLHKISKKIECIIIDGYVTLGDQPGLGKHLSYAVAPETVIIGVAKKFFEGSKPEKVLRGISKNPLYITSHGMSSEEAKEHISSMSGNHRIPELLKIADQISKKIISSSIHLSHVR